MAAIEILEVCPKCGGSGIDVYHSGDDSPEKPCENCGTTGARLLGYSSDLDTRLSVIDTKLDALDTKLDIIDTHLDTIETKIDAL